VVYFVERHGLFGFWFLVWIVFGAMDSKWSFLVGEWVLWRPNGGGFDVGELSLYRMGFVGGIW
jgi:hypothetical protein